MCCLALKNKVNNEIVRAVACSLFALACKTLST